MINHISILSARTRQVSVDEWNWAFINDDIEINMQVRKCEASYNSHQTLFNICVSRTLNFDLFDSELKLHKL